MKNETSPAHSHGGRKWEKKKTFPKSEPHEAGSGIQSPLKPLKGGKGGQDSGSVTHDVVYKVGRFLSIAEQGI